MCGISGELRFDGAQPDLAVLGSMNAVLKRRGPDHEGCFADGPLALGHRRLSIIDLSEASNQPIVDAALKLALVFNGTIYNYRELRAELIGQGYHFFSDGDTEVILKAYRAWGRKCVNRLHGIFAFAIWDIERRTLMLARDRLGIKPLYYTLDGRRLRFASMTQALLAAGDIDTSLDPVALHHHLTLHAVVPAPRTILNGVRKLTPGTTLTVNADGSYRHDIYWRLHAHRPAQEYSEQEWITQTRDVLSRAIERQRLASDVPVGVLLSGGLDSSLLVGLLDRLGQRNLLTFSIGFEDVGSEEGSEFRYSDVVVERFRTRHHKFTIPNSEILRRLPEAVAAMSEPMVGQDAIAFYLLAERVSPEVKVVLSGQGADEVYGGYFWYPRMAAEQGSALHRFRVHYFDRDHDELLEMLTPPYRCEDVTGQYIASRLADPGADSFMDQVLRLDVTTLIVDDPVKRVDNMTMAWGLEARVPFLDYELVEHAACMPPELKLKEGGKFPLKRIARGLLPDAVIDRPKGYFPVPALKYVKGAFYEFMRDVVNSDAARRRGLFRREYVDKVLTDPERHFTRIQGNKLWHLALLEYWLQMHVDVK